MHIIHNIILCNIVNIENKYLYKLFYHYVRTNTFFFFFSCSIKVTNRSQRTFGQSWLLGHDCNNVVCMEHRGRITPATCVCHMRNACVPQTSSCMYHMRSMFIYLPTVQPTYSGQKILEHIHHTTSAILPTYVGLDIIIARKYIFKRGKKKKKVCIYIVLFMNTQGGPRESERGRNYKSGRMQSPEMGSSLWGKMRLRDSLDTHMS